MIALLTRAWAAIQTTRRLHRTVVAQRLMIRYLRSDLDNAERDVEMRNSQLTRLLADRDRRLGLLQRIDALPNVCDACAAKLGAPDLCALCLAVRALKGSAS